MFSRDRLPGYIVSVAGVLVLCCSLSGFIADHELSRLAGLGLPANELPPYRGFNLVLVDDALANAVIKFLLAGVLMGAGAACAWKSGA